jgi:hypothetical protein
VLDDDALDLVRHIVEIVDDLVEMREDLALADEFHGISVARRSEQRLAAAGEDFIARPSIAEICTHISEIRSALAAISESSGTALRSRRDASTLSAASSRISGEKSRSSNDTIAWADLFIWSMVSSIPLIR